MSVPDGLGRGRALLGRDPELAAARAALTDVQAESARLVLVTGEAGIGKTRLLDEIASIAEDVGIPVVRGAWLETEGVPAFWAWRQLLQRVDVFGESAGELTPSENAAISRLAPDAPWLRPTEVLQSMAEESREQRFIAFQAMTRLLTFAAQSRGLAILLDDLHWADAPSLRLLEHVLRSLGSARVLVVVAYRDAGPGHRNLRQTLGELARFPGAIRMEMRGLDQQQCAACIATASGQRPAPDVVRRIHERTGGNPFFVMECGRLLGMDATMPHGSSNPLSIIPASVRDVVLQRLGRVSPACRGLLEAAAVIGTPAGQALLASVTEVAANQVLVLLDEAAESALLHHDLNRTYYAFTHDLLRDAVYQELPLARRAELHQRVAEHLERRLGVDHDIKVNEVAHHWLRASTSDLQTARAAERAGRLAMSQLAFEDAATLFTTAAEASASAGEPAGVVAHMLVDAARALFQSGDLTRAAATCRQAAGVAHRADDVGALAEAALVLQDVGDERVSALVAELCDDALATLPANADTVLRSRLLAQRASAAHYLAEYALLAQLSADALREAEASGDDGALVSALRARQLACSGPDGLGERGQIADRMVTVAQQRDRPLDELWGRLWRIDNLVQQGRLDDAGVELDSVSRLVDRIGLAIARWHLERCRFAIAHARGDFTLARDAIRRGEAVAEAAGLLALRRKHMQQALIAWLTGEPCDEALSALQRVADTEGQGVAVTQRITTRAMLACLLLTLGRGDEATAQYERLPPLDAGGLMPATRTVALAYRAIAAAGLERRADCTALYARMLPYAEQFASGGAGTVGCHGSIESHLGACAVISGRVDTAVQHLERAVARNDDAGMRPWATISRYWLAVSLRQRGREQDIARALNVVRDAAEAAAMLGMLPLLRSLIDLDASLRSGTARGRVLTPREEEIAALVSHGLTNREIGAAMHISIRTVDNHVQHILDKLGLRSRAHIASWVTSRPAR